MSHHTLQKVLVRMLFDEELVEATYRDSARALNGLDLTDDERRQLLSVDRRAWRSDALRRRRTLKTLVEEYKVSTTIILSETRSLASLEHFFSSRFFHSAIQERGSMGLAFSEFLLDGHQRGAWRGPQILDAVRLEATMAGCRRTLEREGEDQAGELPATINDRMRIKFAPGCNVASFQANVIETIQCVERYLFELSLIPAMALCDDAPRLTGLPEVDQRKKVYLLFSPGAEGIALTHLDKTTFLILYETRHAVEISSLLARLGATQEHSIRIRETLAAWCDDGVLMIGE